MRLNSAAPSTVSHTSMWLCLMSHFMNWAGGAFKWARPLTFTDIIMFILWHCCSFSELLLFRVQPHSWIHQPKSLFRNQNLLSKNFEMWSKFTFDKQSSGKQMIARNVWQKLHVNQPTAWNFVQLKSEAQDMRTNPSSQLVCTQQIIMLSQHH